MGILELMIGAVLIELLIVVAGIIIIVTIAVPIFANPNGPPVAGACGLVVRPWRKDYCSGNCTTAGQTCVVTATKPWAWGIGGATQAAACACGVVVGPPPPGSVPGIPATGVNPGGADIAPVTGDTHTGG